MAIKDLPSLRRHLHWAIELEHSTIPPYLTALYSLHPGKNEDAKRIILSVVIEEMLHMTLAANVLNAIGGSPKLNHSTFMPSYPTYMPHSNKAFMVGLHKFSKDTVKAFMMVEKPAPHGGIPEDENYETIGQFYDAIEEALVRLSSLHGEKNVFTGDIERQITPDIFHYDGAGKVIVVKDILTAKQALEEVIEQGEGLDHQSVWDGDRSMFHHGHNEVSHYFRYEELLAGRHYRHGDTPQTGPTGAECVVDWDAVYNIQENPKTSRYPQGSEIRKKMDDFNKSYSDLLIYMHRAFNGEPDQMRVAVGMMYEIKNKAVELVQMPSGDGVTTVGMSFEYIAPDITEEKDAIVHIKHPQTPVDKSPKIKIRPDGPYIVEGEVPLRVKTRVLSDLGEAQTWKTGELLRERGPYALCRCGRSDTKPFCDGNHARGTAFVGTETAETSTRAERAKLFPGPKLNVYHDRTICAFSTFCENKATDVWDMAEKTDDNTIRAQVISMIERCPSGALTYELLPEQESIEPDLPVQISVTDDGPLWVTGGIPIERADGKPCETRNRVTLCRCGHSKNKPFCDGTHIDIMFVG